MALHPLLVSDLTQKTPQFLFYVRLNHEALYYVIFCNLLLLPPASCYLWVPPVTSSRLPLFPCASYYFLRTHVTPSRLMLLPPASCYIWVTPITSSRLPLLTCVSCYFLRPHVTPSRLMLLPPFSCYLWVPPVISPRLPLLPLAWCYFLGLHVTPPRLLLLPPAAFISSSLLSLPPSSSYFLRLPVTFE